MNATPKLLRELATRQPTGKSTLSLYVRTDPRDPANTAHVPAWVVALRNGLREVGSRLEDGAPRAQRLAFRGLAEQVEGELLDLDPAERARGVAWFVTPDRALDRRISLQLAPRADVVRWDERPFVSPLVELVDRGRTTGVVLVAGERVRVLQWEGGHANEPKRSLYELELGDWREYAAYAMANPARAQQTATNDASFEQRVEDWRGRFLRDAAEAVTRRLPELGWERLVVAAEGQVMSRFVDALPEQARRLLDGQIEANLLWEEPPTVAARLEAQLESTWREALLDRAARTVDYARPDGSAVAGFGPVLEALVRHQVDWLVLDPHHRFEGLRLSPAAAQALGNPAPELLAERAVELAVAGGAEVSALAVADSVPLATAGGIAATLRY
jgi:Bacterial archaeo-eukaryotic release factor family 10